MVEAVRAGASMRAVARRWGTSLLTVQRWVARAADRPLDEVDWADRPRAPHRTRRVADDIEDEVLRLRVTLGEGVLGDIGPDAIHAALRTDGTFADRAPSVRTVARILGRRGATGPRHHHREPPPPRGWYLPGLTGRTLELDSFDTIEHHHLDRGVDVTVLTGVSLHGGLPAAWVGPPCTAQVILERILAHWAVFGRPAYAQFDNDSRFHGGHGYPDILGRVVRACLALSVVPVFAPPGEHGFQNAVEGFNALWKRRVLERRYHEDLGALVEASDAWVDALRASRAARIAAAPVRSPMPAVLPRPDLPPTGRMAFIRRTDDEGRATVLGRPYDVDPAWPSLHVRADLDLGAGTLSFHRLRRSDPADQPLVRVHPYRPVTRHTHPSRRSRDPSPDLDASTSDLDDRTPR